MNGVQQRSDGTCGNANGVSQSDLVQQLQRQVEALTAKVAALETQQPHTTQQLQNSSTFAALTGNGQAPSAAAAPALPGHTLQRPDPEQPPAVPMSAARIVMHELVLGHMGDAMAICYGGQVLSWIDICAGLAAKAVAQGPCVTASVDAVHFLAPLRVGSVAIIAAMVNRTFASSMEVGVRVEEEDMRTGARIHCCSAYLTFVAVSARTAGPMQPLRALPRVVATQPAHAAIHAEAEVRRAERLAARQAVKASRERRAEQARMRLQPVTHRQGGQTLAPALEMRRAGGMVAVSPAATSAHMTQLVLPQHANSLAITFGGVVMRWMEQAAYIAASRVGRGGRHLLTASMDSIAFRHPTRVGDIVYISAQVTGIFGSSMEVYICVDGESPGSALPAGGPDNSNHGGDAAPGVFHCGSAFATVVSAAGPWPPVAVPVPFKLEPSTDEEHLRCKGAKKRRTDRLAMRQALLTKNTQRPSLDGSPPAGIAGKVARPFGMASLDA